MRRSCFALLLAAPSLACLEVSAWAVVGATQRVTQFSPTIEDVDGNPANWSVTAYAICAFP
jgi:hypothetical protein